MLTPTADNPADPHAATTAGRSLQRSQEPHDLQDNGHWKIKPWITSGTGKTHLAIGLGSRACQAGHRVAFATAAHWVARPADAHTAGRLQAELVRLGRYPLLVVDEVGCIPFESEAANLFFQLVSVRYERASLIVTSNKPFGKRTGSRQRVRGGIEPSQVRVAVRPCQPWRSLAALLAGHDAN